ncbi:MAG: alpha-amylase [Candidatus Eisenbacteria bacterium]|nr:alpha-amylase [Candidatus Eisenbacteria bacterium]
MTPEPVFEFHVSRAARDRYAFDALLFVLSGNVVFAGVDAARDFAHRINTVRGARQHPELAVNPGALYAMGLIDEALHAMVALYRAQRDPRALTDALPWFEARLGREALDRALLAFADEFPVVPVYRGTVRASEWLAGATGGVPHRAVALEEMMLLWLANLNPAFRPFAELFDDRALATGTAYREITGALRAWFDTRPRFGPGDRNLVDLLRAPALASPDSLEGQLAYIRDEWEPLLGDFVRRLLTALDVLKEEELAIFLRYHPARQFGGAPPGLGPSGRDWVVSYAGLDPEYERFSRDLDWMPRTVLIAKTVYVWLDQLSRRCGRAITRLDQVPDEELDALVRRGINSLWLIGVWERSRASQRIKRLCGNPDAVASAYSLDDYVIAQDLGGEEAFAGLRERAAARGLRLASDMVPNHVGIDAPWVIRHPEWFVQLRHLPFPAYSFNGPDLSNDGRVEIKIEDHYYDRTDASVVFRRLDRHTGETRYFYHGNDGTAMPWNDTAQLDYLNPEVREAVIQTILHVARQFPIIRFDAAMTLTKRHYQRLWFPEPGSGGAIPTRAEHGLTRAEFNAAMPAEFWREVVDRVAAEAPNTLLLAEAFWLMEGYFVRTLGMHRVYNSAFMNMLRDEENANYRSVMKNTLEFDPEVLKRFVNFMSNPDERTSVDQFGKGDKYFGVCTLMITLPGLPMFGHGQIEGLTEKYGMEYRRAYYDEQPDPWLVGRHEREIFPLLHRRPLFADAQDFLLYDFYTDAGHVNEDVYAYSNRRGEERGLVVYNNRHAGTRGWIRVSCAYATKAPDGSRILRQRSLGEAFGLGADPGGLVAFRDARSGLEYVHRARDLAERGMHLKLDGYACRVLLDWRDIPDDGGRPWGALSHMLAGHGVPSLDDALRKLELQPVHDALRSLLEPALARGLAQAGAGKGAEAAAPAAKAGGSDAAPAAPSAFEPLVERAVRRTRRFLEAGRHFASGQAGQAVGLGASREWRGGLESACSALRARLEAAVRVPALEKLFSGPWPEAAREVLPAAVRSVAPGARPGVAPSPAGRVAPEVSPAAAPATASAPTSAPAPPDHAAATWATVLAWCALEALGGYQDPVHADAAASALFDAMRLQEPLADALGALGVEGEERWRVAARVRAAFTHAEWAPYAGPRPAPTGSPFGWLRDPNAAWAVGVHEHEGEQYLVQEPFERLLWWMALRALLDVAAAGAPDAAAVRDIERQVEERRSAAEAGGYRVDVLLEASAKP